MATKLEIRRCKLTKTGAVVDSAYSPFIAMINPTGYTREESVSYSSEESLGQKARAGKIKKYQPEKITLREIVLDGTGAATRGVAFSVKARIDHLYEVAYLGESPEDGPPVIEILWGGTLGQFRASSINVDYTLFKPSGEPLRARVTLGLERFEPAHEDADGAGGDESSTVEVGAGDTLPAICKRSGAGTAAYMDTARRNDLTSFRSIAPGTTLTVAKAGVR